MKNKKKSIGLRVVIIGIILVVLLFLALIGFITDYLWFKELGYVSVFFKQLVTQLQIGVPTFVIVTFLAYIYLKLMKKSYHKKMGIVEVEGSKAMNRVAWGMGGLFGIIITYFVVTRTWFNVLKFTNAQDFGVKDPVFNMDVSFYAFKLEFISQMNTLLLIILIVFIIMTLIYYSLLIGDKNTQPSGEGSADPFKEEDRFEEEKAEGGSQGQSGNAGTLSDMIRKLMASFTGGSSNSGPTDGNISRPKFNDSSMRNLFSIASKQLTVVGVILFLMIGLHFVLKQYDLLYAHVGEVYGAGYTSMHVTIWVYRILAGLSVLGAVAVIFGIKKRKLRPLVTIPVIMIVVGIIGAMAGGLVQKVYVSSNELAKESKYLERNIEYTQKAYKLDKVKGKDFSANNTLTSQDIKNNDPTISNIRINDYMPVQTFYNQTQAIRQYYTFKDVDVDRYMLGDEYTQTFLATREIDEAKISETWVNQHLKYTHGYGVVLSQVDKITASGQPEMLVDSIPPVSKAKGLEITRPEVYFGEMTDTYTVVGTTEDEFDYPDGDSNKYSRYEGSAGIKLNPLNRFMFAVKEKSLKLLVSSSVSSKSKIMVNRNIEKRVQKIMPYLDYDQGPYMATVEGKLYWIIDAYTTTNKFPYSEPFQDGDRTNYIRNSVKVVIDAYNGDTNFYIVDEDDAIAQTYKSIYPKLFKDFDEMPEGIRAHIRYPNAMFNVQAQVYQRYHMKDVKVFYQKEDLWDISKEVYGTEEQTMTPNYYIMKIPGETDAEFVNSVPFTPRDKRNLTGLLLARNDGEHYGEMVLFKMPKGKIVYGPMQIEAQIDQSTEISKEFSLWDSGGSKYSRGNMFIVPIEESFLYVEPVYLEAQNSSIPEVKRVIVAYGDRIAYEATLGEALDSLFGEGSSDEYEDGDKNNTDTDKPGKTPSKEDSNKDAINKAVEAYDKATKAQSEGDWAAYGKHMKELEEALGKLK